MKTLPPLRQGFASMGLVLTTGVILLGGGLLAWEWRGAHPSSKTHAAKAAKTSGEHHHQHKEEALRCVRAITTHHPSAPRFTSPGDPETRLLPRHRTNTENMKTNRMIIHRIAAIIAAASAIGGSAFAASARPAKTTTEPASRRSSHAYQPHTRTWFGAMVEGQAPRYAHQSPKLRIVRVQHGSPADHAGLHEGDILAKFDGRKFSSARQLRGELNTLSPGHTVPVEIWRHGRAKNLSVTLAAAPLHAHAAPVHTTPAHAHT